MSYDKIIIKYVDLELETPMCINCDSFETSFKYDSLIINDNKLLKKLVNNLSSLKTLKKKYHVDTRIKIICYKEGNVIDKFCLDGIGIMHNTSVYSVNKKLLYDIKKIIASSKNH
jgi:hypothetical protein